MHNRETEPEHRTGPSADEGVLMTPDGHAPSGALDRNAAMELVQRYVETERYRSRRILLWISSVFLFIVLLVLIIFISIGIFVLRNSRRATEIVNDFQARTAVYASEMVGMDGRIGGLESDYSQVNDAVKDREARRAREGAVLKSDLKRFSRWVASKSTKESSALSALENRLREMEEMSAMRDGKLDLLKEQYSTLSRTGSISWTGPNVSGSPPAAQGRVEDDAMDRSAETLDETAATPPAALFDGAAVEYAAVSTAAVFPELHTDMLTGLPAPPEGRRREVNVVTFANGDRYEGEFNDGLFSGWGTYYYVNGDRHEGTYRNDMKNGRGAFTYANGGKYVGDFKNGMKEGKGSFVFPNGNRYAGEFRRDMISGNGSMVYQNGNRYAGEFRNGIRHGNGRLIFSNGDVYEGAFRDDLRSGRGAYSFTDGAKYIGEFKNGIRHGEGRYIYAGGEEYIGLFRNGMKHGRGICVYPDGKRLTGVWEDDKFVKVVKE